MHDDVAQQPLARAMLAKLAAIHGDDHPLGSFARSVLGGASLRSAASNPWHAEGMGRAFTEVQRRYSEMSAEERAGYEREAQRLRSVDAADVELANDRDDRTEDGYER
ncbi:hypothetical protein [Micromonospora sp. NPDC049679]|uniref:hypothetical protein n=1 Tax=Micromonospora sp. NPDC049679 TaxID=3155920 RepID=UPI00340BA611